jgi:hypothetical protein
MKLLALALALTIAASPTLALAQRGGGGGHPAGGGGGGGGGRPAGGGGGARPAGGGGMQRPQPAPGPQRPGGGFDMSGVQMRPQPATRPATPQTRPAISQTRPMPQPNPGGNRPPTGGGTNRPPSYQRPPGHPGYYGRPPGGRPPTVIYRPGYANGPAWGWNRGVAWYPSANYWGGGFWGALAIGVASAAVFGSIVANDVTYTSYQVQPDSPGATMLINYQLTQVPCGPPGLVQVYGPDNSVICAQPNQIVSAGDYDLDAEQLTLLSIP